MHVAKGLLLRIALVGLAIEGCTPVAPWERELLSRRAMQVSGDEIGHSLDPHVHDYREASLSVTTSAESVGCGCN